MDVHGMRRQGWSINEIARDLGLSPRHGFEWLKTGGPPAARTLPTSERVVDDALGQANRRTDRAAVAPFADERVRDHLGRGFAGSYPSVVRRSARPAGPTVSPGPPGVGAHRDRPGRGMPVRLLGLLGTGPRLGLSDDAVVLRGRGVLEPVSVLVVHHLGRPRAHLRGTGARLRGLAGCPGWPAPTAWEHSGPPRAAASALHPPTLEFATTTAPRSRPARPATPSAKARSSAPSGASRRRSSRSGRPRPAREHRGANTQSQAWLAERVNGRVHSVTKERPLDRLVTERRFLLPLPARRFDTAYSEPRRVHVAVPLIEWDAVRYSVPPACLGQKVGCRVEVDSGLLEITWGGTVVGTHRLVAHRTTTCGTRSTASAAEAGRPRAHAGHPCAWSPVRLSRRPARTLRRLRRGRPRPRTLRPATGRAQ